MTGSLQFLFPKVQENNDGNTSTMIQLIRKVTEIRKLCHTHDDIVESEIDSCNILLIELLFDHSDERACFMVLHVILKQWFLHLGLSLSRHAHCQECPKYCMNPLSL